MNTNVDKVPDKSRQTLPKFCYADLEFLGDLVVVGGEVDQLLLQLALDAGEVDVDGLQLVDLDAELLARLLGGTLLTQSLGTSDGTCSSDH